MAKLPPDVEIAGVELDGDHVRYRLRYDVRQVLAEALQDALPSRDGDMFMRQLAALEQGIITRGGILADRAVLCREVAGWPSPHFTCQRVANHGGLNHWGKDDTGAELTWLIKGDDPVIDVAHLEHQRTWSEATFGPGQRTEGVVAHIRKELAEIEEYPTDLVEWVDVIILAFDGAWRAGHDPIAVLQVLLQKQAENEQRIWPDWRTADPAGPIEHVRE